MRKYTIIKADVKSNKNDILEVLEKNLPDVSEQRFAWNCEECPQGNAQWWLAKEDGTKAFVGSGALFPRNIWVNGRLVYAGIAGDFAVNKEHRAFGPALKLQKVIQDDMHELGFKFIYGTPNELSKVLFLKAGYVILGKHKKFVKILKTEYKHKTHLPLLARKKIFSKISDFIIKKFSKENSYQRPPGFSVEMPEYFDERFDNLCAEACRQYKVVGDRNAAFLNWRYKQSTYQNYKIFTLIKSGGLLAGYVVYYIQENMCRVVDLMFINSDGIADCLLAEFLLHLRKCGLGSVTLHYLGGDHLMGKLKTFNFFLHPKEDIKVMLYVKNDPQLERQLLVESNWYLLEGDNVL